MRGRLDEEEEEEEEQERRIPIKIYARYRNAFFLGLVLRIPIRNLFKRCSSPLLSTL